MTATHPEYAALLGAVLDDPADDTARLVLADWLQENGQGERAEFVRVQCEMAHIPTCCRRKARRPCFQDGRCRWCSLAIRRNQLMWLSPGGGPPLWKTWCEGVDPSWVPLDTDNDDWRFGLHRGFLAGLRLPAADWLTHSEAIRKSHPVTRVRLMTGLDWFSGPDDRVILLEERNGVTSCDREYTCWRVRYGQWWGQAGTVLEHILAAEWPGVTFELPE